MPNPVYAEFLIIWMQKCTPSTGERWMPARLHSITSVTRVTTVLGLHTLSATNNGFAIWPTCGSHLPGAER